MSISDIGHRFIVEPSSTALTVEERALLSELKPAGVMFRKRNFLQDVSYREWLNAYRDLVNDIRSAIGRDRLIFCIDHEGGRVVRPPLPITRFPYPARWDGRTVEVARAMATELKSLGVNLIFGPVADIHSNPKNPVINERAFGRTAAEVLAGALPFADTISQLGMLPCAKHFPGHGDTATDSHYALPVVDLSRDELAKRELLPFQSLIDGGIPFIMTAHILLPQIDPKFQATLSRKILGEILREQMGFQGVVIADALGMAGARGSLGDTEALCESLRGGLDLFLMAGDAVAISDAVQLAGLLQKIRVDGEVEEDHFARSAARIQKQLVCAERYEITELPIETFEAHQRLADELSAKQPWQGFDLHVPGFE